MTTSTNVRAARPNGTTVPIDLIAANLRRAAAVNDLLATLALTGAPESLDADSLIESTSIVATELQAALAALNGSPARLVAAGGAA